MRAVRIDASAPKKQKLASECPLGKLYDSGASRLKNGTGRARWKVSFSVVFSIAAPIIVTARSHASLRHPRDISHMNMRMVAHVRKKLEPQNEMPRIVAVTVGEAIW